MAEALHAYDEMSVGRVFARGFGVIADNPLTVFVIGFIGVIPTMAADWYVQTWRMEFDRRTHLLGYLGVTFGSALVALIVQAIVSGALVRATMAHSRGERATIGECAQTSLTVALPLVGLALLEGIAIVFGMIFLLVPGIILYLMWAVASPALVAERIGVIEALARSIKLTEGARWKIFGIEAILILGASAFGAVIGGGTFAATGVSATVIPATGFPIGWLLFNAFIKPPVLVVAGTIRAALYVELRNWKEGLPEQSLAEIFA